MDLLYFLGVPGREVNVPAQEWSKLINQNFRFQLYLCANPYGGRYSPDATYFRVVADMEIITFFGTMKGRILGRLNATRGIPEFYSGICNLGLPRYSPE
jgi:hypothetical protein